MRLEDSDYEVLGFFPTASGHDEEFGSAMGKHTEMLTRIADERSFGRRLGSIHVESDKVVYHCFVRGSFMVRQTPEGTEVWIPRGDGVHGTGEERDPSHSMPPDGGSGMDVR
ncbi:MAG: hypothetical protein CMJ61_02580 [Planctomycetaceae bacterium]|jgi:hypothetical protein|nr:hypothetical protein [Planctomycetaceae bacterium]